MTVRRHVEAGIEGAAAGAKEAATGAGRQAALYTAAAVLGAAALALLLGLCVVLLDRTLPTWAAVALPLGILTFAALACLIAARSVDVTPARGPEAATAEAARQAVLAGKAVAEHGLGGRRDLMVAGALVGFALALSPELRDAANTALRRR